MVGMRDLFGHCSQANRESGLAHGIAATHIAAEDSTETPVQILIRPIDVVNEGGFGESATPSNEVELVIPLSPSTYRQDLFRIATGDEYDGDWILQEFIAINDQNAIVRCTLAGY